MIGFTTMCLKNGKSLKSLRGELHNAQDLGNDLNHECLSAASGELAG